MTFFDDRDGYAAGNRAAVALEDGVGRFDDLAAESVMNFSLLAAGPKNYWAVIEVNGKFGFDKTAIGGRRE